MLIQEFNEKEVNEIRERFNDSCNSSKDQESSVYERLVDWMDDSVHVVRK